MENKKMKGIPAKEGSLDLPVLPLQAGAHCTDGGGQSHGSSEKRMLSPHDCFFQGFWGFHARTQIGKNGSVIWLSPR